MLSESRLLIGAILGGALLLSYQMPIYISRFVGREGALRRFWYTSINDELPSQIIFLAIWFSVGFLMWAGPIVYAVSLFHPLTKDKVRAVSGKIFFPIALTFSFAANWIDHLRYQVEEKKEQLEAAKVRRAQLEELYQSGYTGEFPDFKSFLPYFEWMERNNHVDFRKPLTDFADPVAEARSILGLGPAYTQDDLRKRYLDLIKRNHPDVVGPNEIANLINKSNDILKARRSHQ